MVGCSLTGGRRKKSHRRKSHHKKHHKKNLSLLSRGSRFVGSVFKTVNRSGKKFLKKTGKIRKSIIGMR